MTTTYIYLRNMKTVLVSLSILCSHLNEEGETSLRIIITVIDMETVSEHDHTGTFWDFTGLLQVI